MKIGDIVVRKSYNKDIKFKVVDIKEYENKKRYILKGKSIRIIADAFEDDLEVINISSNEKASDLIKDKIKQAYSNKKNFKFRNDSENLKLEQSKLKDVRIVKKKAFNFGKSGSVLHIDGDFDYLCKCMEVYEELLINAHGECVEESKQPDVILDLVKFYSPDIVDLTGHDSMSKNIYDYMDLSFYKNSKYFVESVKKLRRYEKNLDNLVIFVGACQSCYELLIEAGANFATSPKRVLVHCLDPVLVCSKVFNTSIDKTVRIDELLNETITGFNGIGGIQTRGKYREGFPKSFYM